MSLEDDVLRLFGSQTMLQLFQNMGLDESQPVVEKGMTKSILRAQKRIEGNHFGVRKNLTDFDAVNNEQRELIYEDRSAVLESDDISGLIMMMLESLVEELVCTNDWKGLTLQYQDLFCVDFPLQESEFENLTGYFRQEAVMTRLISFVYAQYKVREAEFTKPVMREIEKQVMLQTIDRAWMQHMSLLEQLKQGIGLTGYGQRDPVVEYRVQAFDAFDEMLSNIRKDAVKLLFGAKLKMQESVEKS